MRLDECQPGLTVYYVPPHLIKKSFKSTRILKADLGIIERANDKFVFVNFAGNTRACKPEDLYLEIES